LQLRKINSSGSIFFFLHCSCETQGSPALQKNNQALKNCFFRAALVKLRQAWLFKKRNQALKTCFFRATLWNSGKPGFAKNNFSGSIFFFRMPLVKSANATSLPCLSSLQIVRMHAIHN